MVKNEILNIELIEDLIYYNFTYELNWNKSLYFVSNLNKYSKRQTDVNMIVSEICIRCEKEVYDWKHIWIRKINELSAIVSHEEQMLEKDQAALV
ncbi:hypothetical protein RhiirA5_408552 [Rhizophagus irregularis]|nr:hypothetical protein RhiirA5_408552 [Rhizophagus irregularis]PKC58719.1 hypothetical protein RhiirA1_470571 [Rhizophagus irregularis]PKC61700.1 hypothetical protein RhiirA1_466144 [Rhizophagus irregularis]PKY22815.1 hypothetical protein RhiirB3_436854 [Rhizophagus irregularis]